jgi:hypothetical protein
MNAALIDVSQHGVNPSQSLAIRMLGRPAAQTELAARRGPPPKPCTAESAGAAEILDSAGGLAIRWVGGENGRNVVHSMVKKTHFVVN